MTGSIPGMAANYNSSSTVQRSAIEASDAFIKEAVGALDVHANASSPLVIVDFGSAQGSNSIYAMKTVIAYLGKTNEVLVVHNDLPTNDWSALFQLLADDNSYKNVISARSFYEQCLPDASVSLAYSSSTIHWLSKKPCNILDHCCIHLSRDQEAHAAFQKQACADYCQFLEHRARELRKGGILLLSNVTRNELMSGMLDLLFQCARSLPMTEEELVEYNLPAYFRSAEECVDTELFTRCSLQQIRVESCSVALPIFKQFEREQSTLAESTHSFRSFVQAWSESVLRQALTNNVRPKEKIEPMIDRFWTLLEERVKESPHLYEKSLSYVYIVLKKVA